MEISITLLNQCSNLDFFKDNGDKSHGWETIEHTVDKDGMQSSDLLLFFDSFTPPFFPSPLIMKSVKRFTSDNFTGFNRNSSAPSSKQLPIKFQPKSTNETKQTREKKNLNR